MPTVLNIVAYQISWFACVLGAANKLSWVGTAVSLVVVGVHLAISERRFNELKLILAAAIIGFTVDSALASSGTVSFVSGVWFTGITPHWMLALWLTFATTLNVSLRWLVSRPSLAVAFGALGGPIAYYAGAKLGAMTIPSLNIALPAIAVSWALAMWLLVIVAARLQTASPTQARIA